MSPKYHFVPTLEALETRNLLSAATQTVLAGPVLGPTARPDGLPVITLQRDFAPPAGQGRGGASQVDAVIHQNVVVGRPFTLDHVYAVPSHVAVKNVVIDWKDGTRSTVGVLMVNTRGAYHLYRLHAAHTYQKAGDYATTFAINGTGVPHNAFTFHAGRGQANPAQDPGRLGARQDAIGSYFAQARREYAAAQVREHDAARQNAAELNPSEA